MKHGEHGEHGEQGAADPARARAMSVESVYPLYLQKIERKGRSKAELDRVMSWLTGYDEDGLKARIESGASFEAFFADAPSVRANAAKITGVVCGYRVEDIKDEAMRSIRALDKLVDELAKGKPMDKILRA